MNFVGKIYLSICSQLVSWKLVAWSMGKLPIMNVKHNWKLLGLPTVHWGRVDVQVQAVFIHVGGVFGGPHVPNVVNIYFSQAVWVLKSKVFGQKSTVVKWNYQILCLHPVTVGQKVPILDFQSEFSMSKIVRIFLIFFFIEE